jgi:hypothetical protein
MKMCFATYATSCILKTFFPLLKGTPAANVLKLFFPYVNESWPVSDALFLHRYLGLYPSDTFILSMAIFQANITFLSKSM